MLNERELEDLVGELGSFRETSGQQQRTLDNLLEKYEALVEDYRRLRSDYEEEKESREKYKKLARGQDRNPFVLVLIDGDGYPFDDRLIRGGSDGGATAARLLSNSVRQLVARLGPEMDQCRIMIRIYANLHGLSKAMAKANLAGNEARSLAPFTSSFTRSENLFDFVDVGDSKDTTEYKIRGNSLPALECLTSY
ncbi:hypothetical protein LTR66_012108 [Elasticomyces elasticus]|nr:hypothetical protein LTR66_012108 [Elasticomyces elasticus]